ncbi:MAG: family tricarboxylate transporter, receptor protein [Hyphomicrobiales bacterium]|nr:family tricarboxylate transporter, receptor protein [Hyphomicrobiales bacterium]
MNVTLRAVRMAWGAAALLVAGSGAHAQSPAEFYKGRNVSLVVSASPGGGYDSVARVVARHLGRHIPGNPTIVVNNMPGAGGVRAPNHLYSVAEKDGSVIGLMQNTVPFEPLVGNTAAMFDPRKFGWLGSPSHETGVLMVWRTSPARSIEELQTTQITVGVEALASTPAFSARLLINTLGLKLRLVPGYPGSSSALLAMERGEVDAFPNFYSSLMQTRPTWIAEGKTTIAVQWGPSREAALGNVPYLSDIVTEPRKKALVEAASAPLALGRPFMTPPDLPPERLAALQQAMSATFVDPVFAEDARKIGLADLAPRTGEDLARIVEQVYRAAPEVIEQLKSLATGQ